MRKARNFLLLITVVIFYSSCKDKLVLVPEDTSPTATLGESRDGGIIFYLDGTNRHGLIASTSDLTSGGTFSNSTSTSIPDLSNISSSINVSGVTGTAVVYSVYIDVTHTYVGDLTITLQAPNGTTVVLTANNGGGGDNFSGTTFISSGTPIASGVPPYSGFYSPQQPFSNVSSSATSGTWTLYVSDGSSGDVGTLNYWSISFGTQTIKWNNGTSIVTGATATSNGSGSSNTSTIESSQGPGLYAASLCDLASLHGLSDWYLPSKDELSLMYDQQTSIGGFSSSYYWSSSEVNTTTAWAKNFATSTEASPSKNSSYHVRAIRNF